ncbi:unnamed protein product [Calypogeia fissa]
MAIGRGPLVEAPDAGPIRVSTVENVSTPSSGHNDKEIAAKVLGGVGAGLAFCATLLFIITLVVRWRRGVSRRVAAKIDASRSPSRRRSLLCSNIGICNSGKLINETLSQTPKKHIHFSIDVLSQATNCFDEANLVGEGGFGKVYRGVLSVPPFSKVAIKVLTGESSQGVKEFITEIEVLSRLDHKHLVRLLGSCIVDEQLLLVYRHVTNGSLSDHLHGENGKAGMIFPWPMRVKIALGAALGVQHLHMQRPTVLHRDVKSANILLTRGFNAKVCDFGFAKQLSAAMDDPGRFCCTPSRSGAIGTLGYVAPESMMTGEVSSASDVYSFGVVLLELLSGRKPLDFDKPDKEQSLVNWARNLLDQERITELIDPSMPEDLSRIRDSVLLFVRMTRLCLDMESRMRPTIGEVVQTLHVIKSEYETRPGSVTINLSDSDSASEISGVASPSEISQRSEDPRIDINDLEQFSKRFLDDENVLDTSDTADTEDFTKAVRRSSSGGPFTRPLSWLSLGLSNRPSTPPRG